MFKTDINVFILLSNILVYLDDAGKRGRVNRASKAKLCL